MTPIGRALRKTVLEASYYGRDGNLQSVFSALDIMWTLYDRVLRVSPETCSEPDRDIFVCSKGQATLGLLAVLAEKGFLDREELKTFCGFHSRISMQADRIKLPGVEISAGSLGHGLPIAAGMAWAQKIKQSASRVFVLAGDGEMNEGTMWEAVIFAASERLANLILIVDNNHSIDKMIHIGDLREKLDAFGFTTITANGHDEESLFSAFTTPHDAPLAIIAETIRGYGSNTIMNDNSWFHRAPNAEELQILRAEVDHF